MTRPRVPGLLAAVREWASGRADVQAVALVGSWARDAARSDSDVDLVLVVDDVGAWLADHGWMSAVHEWVSFVDEDWGLVQSRRVDHGDGLVVEYGLTTREWATPPIDDGTARVIRDGMVALHDPEGLLEGARHAL